MQRADRHPAPALAGPGRIVVDGAPVPYQAGDSVAMALIRAGAHPGRGGTLCLAGDCGNCVAEVDGIAWIRTCQADCRPGLAVERHPARGGPPLHPVAQPDVTRPPVARRIPVRRVSVDLVVIGAGESGTAAAANARLRGRTVLLLDAREDAEVVAIYGGPTVIVRSSTGMTHVHAREVIVATGAAELHPVCPGNGLRGLLTGRAAELLHAAGIDLGVAVAVGEPPRDVPCTVVAGRLVRIEGTERVSAVVTATGEGLAAAEVRTPCETLILGLGRAPRDLLARMSTGEPVAVIGPAAESFPLPPAPTAGIVCPCAGIGVDDLEGVWQRGFQELELVKRASLAGTGTCQGSVCLPHVRAWVASKSGTVPEPFTARPASRQVTLAEAAADVHLDVFKRTPLHDEHLALGGRLDRFGGWWRPWTYGDHVAEYWAVREGVSLGDVSTLGKLIVSGPDVVELLERIYPNRVGNLGPGRSRYALLLNERGHVIDDGMICRETETRFVLTFTSGGAANAEMWLRDWIETWGLKVQVMDRTMSLAAINVTGPLAGQLLGRAGLADPPRYLAHAHAEVAGVPCHVMRLSFTGEASFELHHPVDRSVELWRTLLDLGRDLGIRPHGLRNLFGLRLEKGHVIVGMDTELDSTPHRLGMDWAVRMDKPEFLGRSALARTALLPDSRRLIGLTMTSPVPTEGSPIWSDGEIVGHVTSSFDSPLLGRAVMLGWLKRTPFPEAVEIDGRRATVTRPPFYDPEGLRARA
ncbi:MAG TPA: glycine cleavage T C-terminal barrel domain-containing protein [Candidatus Limnocylindrales bacterium]|jgi:sarcosine oxidase subunit alpha